MLRIGSSLFAPLAKLYGYRIVFYGCALVSLLGLGLTFLVRETKGTALVSHTEEDNEAMRLRDSIMVE